MKNQGKKKAKLKKNGNKIKEDEKNKKKGKRKKERSINKLIQMENSWNLKKEKENV